MFQLYSFQFPSFQGAGLGTAGYPFTLNDAEMYVLSTHSGTLLDRERAHLLELLAIPDDGVTTLNDLWMLYAIDQGVLTGTMQERVAQIMQAAVTPTTYENFNDLQTAYWNQLARTGPQ
jgi:hypothetical protein